jgi:hypothetical protein
VTESLISALPQRSIREVSGARASRKMALVRPTLTDQKVGTGTVRSLMSA